MADTVIHSAVVWSYSCSAVLCSVEVCDDEMIVVCDVHGAYIV